MYTCVTCATSSAGTSQIDHMRHRTPYLCHAHVPVDSCKNCMHPSQACAHASKQITSLLASTCLCSCASKRPHAHAPGGVEMAATLKAPARQNRASRHQGSLPRGQLRCHSAANLASKDLCRLHLCDLLQTACTATSTKSPASGLSTHHHTSRSYPTPACTKHYLS